MSGTPYVRDGDQVLCPLCRLPLERISGHECPALDIVNEKAAEVGAAFEGMARSAVVAGAAFRAIGPALAAAARYIRTDDFERAVERTSTRLRSRYWKRYVRRGAHNRP